MPLPFFRFAANLEHSGRRIPDAWFVILTFSLMRQLLYYCIEKGTFLTKRLTFYKNDAEFGKIKGFLALNATFYETTLSLRTNRISSSSRLQGRRGKIRPPPYRTVKQTSKEPNQIRVKIFNNFLYIQQTKTLDLEIINSQVQISITSLGLCRTKDYDCFQCQTRGGVHEKRVIFGIMIALNVNKGA